MKMVGFRVDYIYSSSEFISTWKLADLHHHISDASDHNLVQAEFILNQ
jgi:exonuclease III